MDWNKVPTPHVQVAARIVEGAAVIVTSDSGNVTVLNAVGTRVWELIDGERSVLAIAQAIESEYAVSLERAQADVAELIEKLVASQVLIYRN
jgi:hypothetical protein